jgi:hypothetical protein
MDGLPPIEVGYVELSIDHSGVCLDCAQAQDVFLKVGVIRELRIG